MPCFAALRLRIEQRPFFALALLCALALPVAGLSAYLQAENWRQGHLDRAILDVRAELQRRTEQVTEKAALKFETTRKLATLLATDPRIARALLHPPAPGKGTPEVNRHLQDVAETLQLHRVLLMDTGGVCIASNDADQPQNLLGVRLGDRAYVSQALAGTPWTQFVVGRVSSVPGFHFSAPVRQGERILGVVALKVDLGTLAQQIVLPNGFVADRQGVVVLSDTPDALLRAVPGAPVLGLTPEQCRTQYQRDALLPLPMAAVAVEGHEAFLYGARATPNLRHVAGVPREGLSVYGFQDLAPILEDTAQLFRLRLFSAFAGQFLALCLLAGLFVYLLRDAFLRRNMERLNAELREQAQRDPLTGCSNRRLFDELLRLEYQRSARTGQPYALALFDLDTFKTVNDTHGHGVGDATLVHVATLCEQQIREVDLLARLGGDEFAILLPGATESQALEAMGRLALRLEATPLDTGSGRLTQRISVGVAASSGGKSPEELLERADKALYAAKSHGRNRVVGFSSLEAARNC